MSTRGTPTYPAHRPWELEPHYSRHVSAMTSEGLHSKADIAEQLAWRDKRIEELADLSRDLIEAITHFGDFADGTRVGAAIEALEAALMVKS